MLLAIYPDDYTNPRIGKPDASSPRWAELLSKAGHKVRWIDVRRSDILEQLNGCDGFMWRHMHVAKHRQIARRLLPVIEKELGLPVYPDQATCWHYDDKITQCYLLSAAGISIPKTWVCFSHDQALELARTADYPLVTKLWTGAGSENVRLVRSFEEAKRWINLLFSRGVGSMLEYPSGRFSSIYYRLRYAAKVLLTNRPIYHMWETHKDYVILQEFLPDNPFDTRITVIGNRAFGFRRFNRTNDFRASGSGILDTDPSQIADEAVRLAFRVAGRLRTQSLGIDILRHNSKYMPVEISYTYASWAVQSCPGHWELVGDGLIWKPGHMWPEEAQIQDFLARIETVHEKMGAHRE